MTRPGQVARRPGPRSVDDNQVIGVEWPLFLRWFSSVWRQGQHIAVIGPTGCGKTTFAVGITRQRKWVLALDPKGGDDTLTDSGFTRVREWPLPKRMLTDIAEGRPCRVVLGFKPTELVHKIALKELMRDGLDGAWIDGGWTVVCDETQILADRKMMNLSSQIETLQIAARAKLLSNITLFQAPAWVPTACTRQASFIVIFPTQDITVIKTLAEKIGRNWRDLVDILHELPDFHCVVAGLNPRDPLVLTKPEEV